MNRYQPVVNNSKFDVGVYNPVSACEDLTSLNPTNIIPVFFHFLFTLSSLDETSAAAKFRALRFTVVPQPGGEVQDTAYNEALPMVFLYLASLLAKNPTDSLTRHLERKQLGLMGEYEALNLLPTENNYIVDNDTLVAFQQFMSRNTDVLSFTFEIFLGIANPGARHIAYSYAHQLLPSLEYANMNAVMIIEDHLIAVDHPSLINSTVAGCMKEYKSFRNSATRKYGSNWKMTGLLDKDLWNVYSRKKSHTRLRIISAMFASEEIATYNGIIVSGTSIASYKTQPYYERIFNAYSQTAQGFNQVANSVFDQGESNRISRLANRYNATDDYGNDDSESENS